MWQKHPCKSSFKESLRALEVDIHHANNLAAGLPRDSCGNLIQMRLCYSPFAPIFLFFIEWMDYSCTDTIPSSLGLLHILVYKIYTDGMPSVSSNGRKASLRDFYAVIYPSLKQLESQFAEPQGIECLCGEVMPGQNGGDGQETFNTELEREEECGICMESCTKMVLPICGHSMCISCFLEWNARSESCPFCRCDLKEVSSMDLWVLTGKNDVVDIDTIAKENLRNFYLYINNLPPMTTATHVLLLDYMI